MRHQQRFLLVAALLPIVALALAAIDATAVAPTLLFVLVVLATSLCLVAALVLLAVAHRNEQAEIGFVGACFVATSILPLVHGLTTPGVLYGDNAATMTSVFLAVPAGLLGVADLRTKDEITRDHVVRTAELAVEVAVGLGLDAPTVRRVGTAALLHDVGKLEIPLEILAKPGKLTDDEFDVMREHTLIGHRLVDLVAV